jgi:hypothetical protein
VYRSGVRSRAGHARNAGEYSEYADAHRNENANSTQTCGSGRNAFTASIAVRAAAIACAIIRKRRRSTASAIAPPRIGSTTSGTASQSASSPTIAVEPVMS